MRISNAFMLFVLGVFGCTTAEDGHVPQASDFAGEYYYATSGNSCSRFLITEDGYVADLEPWLCDSASRVECFDGRCSLACLDFDFSDTTAIFSIRDMRPFTEAIERLRGKPIPDHVALGPYHPKAVSPEGGFSAFAARVAADSAAFRLDLFFHRVDCEYARKQPATTIPEE